MAVAVLIVDNHSLVANSLAALVASAGFSVEVVAGPDLDGELVMQRAESVSHGPADAAVALVDLNLSAALDGADLVRPLNRAGFRVIVVSGVHDRIRLAKCLQEGALGLFDKALPVSELVDMIGLVAAGVNVVPQPDREAMLAELRARQATLREMLEKFASLTPKERDVLSDLRRGLEAHDIAKASFVSLFTVRSQIHSILVKLDVHSQAQAVRLAEEARAASYGAVGSGPSRG